MTPYQQRKLDEVFSVIKPGDFIYAGQLKSKIVISIEVAYQFLEEIKKCGFLTNIYEIYCHDCGKSTGMFLESLDEFTDDKYCDYYGKNFSLEENVIVLYKVNKI